MRPKKRATQRGQQQGRPLVQKIPAGFDNYQHDHNGRNFLSLPTVMTTCGRISGDLLRPIYDCPIVRPKNSAPEHLEPICAALLRIGKLHPVSLMH